MAESEFLQRIEAEMARTNEFLEQDRAARQRANAEHGQAFEDIRFEMRQMSLRGEKIVQGYLRVLEDMSNSIRDMSAGIRDMSAGMRDMADQVRANTQAVLTLLDERKRGDGPAGAGA
jgi:hypothetical protein